VRRDGMTALVVSSLPDLLDLIGAVMVSVPFLPEHRMRLFGH